MQSTNNLPSRYFAPAYGLGSFGPAIFILTPQVLLLFFMTETLGIPAGMAGGGLLIPKLWELISDPLIGRWSDRLQTRWGRRRPLMAVGSVMFLATFALMFSPPSFNDWRYSLAWVIAFYTLTSTAYSLFTVPYATLLAEATEDPHARTRVAAWRSGLLAIGFVLAGSLAPWLVGAGGGGEKGYAQMGILVGLIAFAGMAGAVVGTGGIPAHRPIAHPPRNMLAPFSNKAFTWLWLGFIVQMVLVSICTAMLPFYDKYWLGNKESTIPSIFAGMALLTVVTTWCWTLLSRRIGKHLAFIVATVLYAAATASLWLIMYGNVGLAFAIILFGIANAGQQLFCFAIVPDIIALQRARTGIAEEGAFTGLWIWGEKVGLAIGAGLSGLVLQLVGFQQGAGVQVLEQSETALYGILLMATLLPALVCLLSIPALLCSAKAMSGLGGRDHLSNKAQQSPGLSSG
ncbi:TPA: MFS transporter [Pseudomonas aeruginosa C40A]|nr:MFS transporter [Pseudomonas aeruginosa C40A]HCL2594806.1 MFS transporter [Pseudomonas aeruginosa C40A]HCL2603969.1 MFS transporter [Pseudomonas aeruginosa C40A]HCL2608400.1 MFS transporter [Pseudomonas aeruginosa C40A]HCL2614769.1 MFS transporter [Pseudomonas aeruginosa C40A]